MLHAVKDGIGLVKGLFSSEITESKQAVSFANTTNRIFSGGKSYDDSKDLNNKEVQKVAISNDNQHMKVINDNQNKQNSKDIHQSIIEKLFIDADLSRPNNNLKQYCNHLMVSAEFVKKMSDRGVSQDSASARALKHEISTTLEKFVFARLNAPQSSDRQDITIDNPNAGYDYPVLVSYALDILSSDDYLKILCLDKKGEEQKYFCSLLDNAKKAFR